MIFFAFATSNMLSFTVGMFVGCTIYLYYRKDIIERTIDNLVDRGELIRKDNPQ